VTALSTAPDGISAIIAAARLGTTPYTVDPSKANYVVVPDGSKPVELDLSAWREAPSRATGTYLPATVDSFDSCVARHLSDDTTIWVHPTSGRIVAVFDDNGLEAPGWRQHKAVLQLETTPEWDHWIQKDGQMMGQEEFAEHVEVGLDDIAEPDGATVLEMAQSFHAKASSTFRQGTRLATGETQFQYDEAIAATAGKSGTMEIPSVLMLALSPFIGEERYKVIARLRYRLASGKLSLGYKLDRPDLVRRDALEQIADKLSNQFPLVYIGSEPQA
jgi:uncharacterized protein YfdQ (DUF2303 family)